MTGSGETAPDLRDRGRRAAGAREVHREVVQEEAVKIGAGRVEGQVVIEVRSGAAEAGREVFAGTVQSGRLSEHR